MKAKQLFTLLLVMALTYAPTAAVACSVCMGGAATVPTDGTGGAGGNIASAVNGAIFLMLGVVGSMLLGVAAFAMYLNRRAQNPASQQLSEMLTNLEESPNV